MKSLIVTKMITTPLGKMLAAATLDGLCLLEYTDTNRIEMQLTRLENNFLAQITEGNSPIFPLLVQELDQYFVGKLKKFTVAIDTKGTNFQMKAWQALMKIPYGETRSYLEQAQTINRPKAFRAVASANRNNRISIIIPCHRVIAKNGALAGYGGGLERKQFLISLENMHKINTT